MHRQLRWRESPSTFSDTQDTNAQIADEERNHWGNMHVKTHLDSLGSKAQMLRLSCNLDDLRVASTKRQKQVYSVRLLRVPLWDLEFDAERTM